MAKWATQGNFGFKTLVEFDELEIQLETYGEMY
jgi:hypothetical protein